MTKKSVKRLRLICLQSLYATTRSVQTTAVIYNTFGEKKRPMSVEAIQQMWRLRISDQCKQSLCDVMRNAGHCTRSSISLRNQILSERIQSSHTLSRPLPLRHSFTLTEMLLQFTYSYTNDMKTQRLDGVHIQRVLVTDTRCHHPTTYSHAI